MGAMDGEAVRRSGFTSGGHVTLGFRVSLEDDGLQRVRIIAVYQNMDGEETTEDLGAYVGEAEEIRPASGEIGHLRLRHGDEAHDLTVHRLDTGRLELRLDGQRVRELSLPDTYPDLEVRRREPFLVPALERPTMD